MYDGMMETRRLAEGLAGFISAHYQEYLGVFKEDDSEAVKGAWDGLVKEAARLVERVKEKMGEDTSDVCRDASMMASYFLMSRAMELEEELAYAKAEKLRLERETGRLQETIDGLGGRDGDIRNGKKLAYRQDVDCLEVHRLWKGGMTLNALAGRYGVHRDTIRSRLREAEGLLGQAEDKGPAVDDEWLPF